MMRSLQVAAHWRRPALAAVAALLMLAALPGASGAWPKSHERDGWLTGLSYGYGVAKITGGENNLRSDWEWGPTPQLRIARMLNQHIALGLEHQIWFDEQGFQDLRVRASMQALNAAVTIFPGRPQSALGGLYAQIGGGISNSRLIVLEPLPPDPDRPPSAEKNEVVFKKDETGPSLFLGLGYEFRVTRHFAPGVSISYNHLFVNDEVFEKVTYWPYALHLNWYF